MAGAVPEAGLESIADAKLLLLLNLVVYDADRLAAGFTSTVGQLVDLQRSSF
jgi:hypothetical protein